MKNLRELTTYASLQEISASLAATVGDGETAPEAVPEGEREFVKLHKTARRKDPYGNKGSEAVKQYTFKEKPKPGFPPEVKEERDNPKIAGTYVVKNSRDKVVAQYYDKKKAQDHVNKIPKSGWKVEHVKEEEEIDEAKESWFDKHGIGTAGFNRSKRDEAARQSNKKEKAKAASARRRAEMSKKHPELAEEGQWGVDELGRFRRVDETSLKKAIDYRDAASIDFSDRDREASAGTNREKNIKVMKRRWRGLDMADRRIKKLTRKEETEIDEAAGIARGMAKSANPLIKRPKFDERGNVILTRDAKRNIEYGKGPRSRKLTGRPYSTKKAFGEDKEQLEKGNWFHRVGASTPNDEKKEKTVLVSPKGEKGAGKVKRIPKSQYDPKKHSLAEEQLDEVSDKLKMSYLKGAVKSTGKMPWPKVGKRVKWIGKTASNLSDKKVEKALKETEQLDELKKERLGSYIDKSAEYLQDRPDYLQGDKRDKNRRHGIRQAVDRLSGTYETGKPLKVMIPGKGDNDKASGPYTMKRRKLYHGNEYEPEGEMIDEGGPTKSHFKMAAETIKSISDEGKRKEHAGVHADLYAKQNPRFDRGKFMAACNVKEETLDELKKSTVRSYVGKVEKQAKKLGTSTKDIGDQAKSPRKRSLWKAYERLGGSFKTKQGYKKYQNEETLDEVSAPGEETWIKHRKGEGGFQKRYGDRWKNVLYATAWKRSKHNYPKG